jgi:hypothetical protein
MPSAGQLKSNAGLPGTELGWGVVSISSFSLGLAGLEAFKGDYRAERYGSQ